MAFSLKCCRAFMLEIGILEERNMVKDLVGRKRNRFLVGNCQQTDRIVSIRTCPEDDL